MDGNTIVLNVESFQIEPNNLTPQLVSVGLHGDVPFPWYMLVTHLSQVFYQLDGKDLYVGRPSIIMNNDKLYAFLLGLFDRCRFITHRGCFDLGVICEAFPSLYPVICRAIADGRIYDTRIMAARILGGISYPSYAGLNANNPVVKAFTWSNGNGRSGGWKDQFPDQGRELALGRLSAQYGGPILNKSEWCIKFGTLAQIPIQDWPEEARDYYIGDLTATGAAYAGQDKLGHIWRDGMITIQTWNQHQDHVRDVRSGLAIAIRSE